MDNALTGLRILYLKARKLMSTLLYRVKVKSVILYAFHMISTI